VFTVTHRSYKESTQLYRVLSFISQYMINLIVYHSIRRSHVYLFTPQRGNTEFLIISFLFGENLLSVLIL